MKNNTYQQILDRYDTYSQQQKKVADFIMTNIHDIIYFPISKLVEAIGVSQAIIVRFAQYLGYQGFNEFRDTLFTYYRDYLSPEGRMKHSIPSIDFKRLMAVLAEKKYRLSSLPICIPLR